MEIINFNNWIKENYGYSKSSSWSYVNLSQKPTNTEEWVALFKFRSNELRKIHKRSSKTEEVISTIEKLITGESEKIPYTDLSTSTAGFQWGKEFADVLTRDGLLKVTKTGNKIFSELNVNDEIKKEMHHKMRGYVAGKNFGI